MELDEPAIRARNVMVRDLITVSPETPVLDIHRLFVEEEIHGAPVIGEDGVVYGVVTTLDLLRVVRDELEPGAGSKATNYFREELPASDLDWLDMPIDVQDRVHALTAADAMTTEVVSVSPDATIAEIAQAMRSNHIHRVLVIDEGALVGVITTFDLLGVLTTGEDREGTAPSDSHAATGA